MLDDHLRPCGRTQDLDCAAHDDEERRRVAGSIMPATNVSCIPVDARPSIRPGVAVGPGETTLTRMPVPLRSTAQVRAKFRIAALDAV
jgi:hypothetical protein